MRFYGLAICVLLISTSMCFGQLFGRRSSRFSYSCYPAYVAPQATPYVAPQPAYVAPEYTPPAAKTFKEQILDLAKAKATWEADLALVDKFGLQGIVRVPPLTSYGGGYPYGQSSYGQILGFNGSTLSGYTAQQVLNAYGPTDPNALYQLAGQATQNAQRLGEQAQQGLFAMTDKVGYHQAEVAKIYAEGQIKVAQLNALNPPKTTIVTNQQAFGPGINPGTPTFNAGPAATASKQAFFAHRAQACASCHDNGAAKGGFSLPQYDTMAVEQKSMIWARLVTNDPVKRMPRTPDGGPGAVTAEQLKLWLEN